MNECACFPFLSAKSTNVGCKRYAALHQSNTSLSGKSAAVYFDDCLIYFLFQGEIEMEEVKEIG